MRLRKIGLMALTAMLAASLSAANRQAKIYVYGIVTSFNDSTVYLTDIQELDSAWLNAKSGFLYGRGQYSSQLHDYMQREKVPSPTCTTVFSVKKKTIEKKYAATKKRYTVKGNYRVRFVKEEAFKYTPVQPDESELAGMSQPVGNEKKRKATKRERK